MKNKLFTLNRFLLFGVVVLFLGSCSLLPFGNTGGPKRSAKNPGSLSTATGREYFSNYPDEDDEEAEEDEQWDDENVVTQSEINKKKSDEVEYLYEVFKLK